MNAPLLPDPPPYGLRRSLALVVLGGCLAMLYTVGIGSPATTDFYRDLGANEFHFGLISGIPMVMLLFQFVGAAFLNRAPRRKATFVVCLIACRLVYVAIAFLPLLLRGRAPGLLVPTVIAMLSLSAATHNFAVPFWFSWMADLVPRPIMNRFWGWRQRAMHITWTAGYLAVTLFLYWTDWPVRVTFPILTVAAVAAGLTDILLFLGVPEPPNLITPNQGVWAAFLEPLRHSQYRMFVVFSCLWTFATTFASSFMLLYVLKVLQLAAWKTALIWCVAGLGTAAASYVWGRAADRHGHRPIMTLTIVAKPVIVVVFLLLTPQNCVWLLPLAFFPDGMLNSGYTVAANGYMLSIAPRANRSMFIAAITGLSGVFGGLASMAAGTLLAHTEGVTWTFSGQTWNHYHLVFALSLLFRVLCIPLVFRIREPQSTHSMMVLQELLDEWPLRVLRFPVGLYRRLSPFRSGSDER
jgi:MFS family permease